MNRRDFLKGTAAAGAAAVLPIGMFSEEKPKFKHPPAIYGERDLSDEIRARLRIELREEALKKYSQYFDFSRMQREYALEVALLMDNQRLMQYCVKDPYPKPRPIKEQLELLFDVYSNFVGSRLVCMQTMARPAEHMLYERIEPVGTTTYEWAEGKKTEMPVLEFVRKEKELCAHTTRMKEFFDYPNPYNIADDFTREIMTDLRCNAGTITTCKFPKDYEGLYVKLCEVSSVIHRKTLVSPHDRTLFARLWIVTSPKIAHFIKDGARYLDWNIRSFGVHQVGMLNSAWEVYVDPLYPKNELLIGSRGRPNVEKKDWYYKAGYLYCPYIPFTEYVVLNPDSYMPMRVGLTRRAKWMGEGGSKYYARLKLE